MNKLILPIAVVMFSVPIASTAFATKLPPAGPPPVECEVGTKCNNGNANGNDNPNACLNSGAGNGGEFGGECGIKNSEVDLDPGNSNNQAPEPTSLPAP